MREIYAALDLSEIASVGSEAAYPSCFAVSALAAHSIGAVGIAMSQLIADLDLDSRPPSVNVDQRLASLWFAQSISPIDWEMPPIWDAIAGVYETRDGFIRLHTNLPHHRAAAISVLAAPADRDAVAAAVKSWDGDALETAIVAAGGAAAFMRSEEEWRDHPQGAAVASEPLVHWGKRAKAQIRAWPATRERPLAGLRVLDLTRVLAGPVATRTLAGFGAEVLRIDPPGWEEDNVAPDISLGKRCSRLDLRTDKGKEMFARLLADADVLVHGYRPGALEGLDFGEEVRCRIAPNLIDVSLCAYGWRGPWAKRRGFDSLVQMSCGIAHSGMKWAEADGPHPLPVQALDHATGYLMAAAVLRALSRAVTNQIGVNARLSLARTAELLKAHGQTEPGNLATELHTDDFARGEEIGPWGRSHRLKPPLAIDGTPMRWDLPASALGTAEPVWLSLS